MNDKYLASTKANTLRLSAANGLNKLEWYIDASFVVHPDFRSHTGAMMKFQGGLGSPIQISAKQKLNTDCSTMTELVMVHQGLPKVLWVPLFLGEQGYSVN